MNEVQTVKNQFYSLSGAGLSNNYQNDIRVFNRYASGRPITAELIVNFFEERAASGLSLATLQRNKSAIKKAIKKAMGEGARLGEIAQIDSFFKNMKAGKGRRDVSVTENKVLSKKELLQLIDISGPKTAIIIEGLYQTACRVSELCNIEIKNCKIENNHVRIKIFRDKTNQDADVFMPVELFNKIRNIYQGNKYLFEVKGKAISRFTIHRLIKNAAAKIGRDDIHAHSLRHTWATMALPVIGLPKVSKYLSHSTPDTTAKFYIHGHATAAEIMACNMLQLTL